METTVSTCSVKLSLKSIQVVVLGCKCLADRTYVHWRSAGTNLVEIVSIKKLNELRQLSVCTKESLKINISGFMQTPTSPLKVCNENKEKKKIMCT